MKRLALFFTLFISSCSVVPKISTSERSDQGIISNGKILATAYHQRAAEYRALCLQAYNVAHARVDELVKENTTKPKAIITDIDETVLNNSPYQAHQALENKDYEQATWTQWTTMANADTIPGAFSFLTYANSKGIEIFYITNRNESEREGTLKNLQKFNFPNADNAHLFLRDNVSSKEGRRKNIEATHEVVMLLGDNLSDFSFLFDAKNSNERMKNVNASSAAFGNRFIILPNITYGDWESSLYDFNYSLTMQQKDSVIKSKLISY
ncbi:MAG: 5'-nucleotidase, lipoprotein e(P4) family [Ginsengibacter sp.]